MGGVLKSLSHGGIQKNGWIVLLMDNPIYKMDDEHGWPHFRKPPFIYIYIYMYVCM